MTFGNADVVADSEPMVHRQYSELALIVLVIFIYQRRIVV
jgi:hypothetical protein